MKCESFEWYLKNVYPELQLPDKTNSKLTTKAGTLVNNRLWSRKKYMRNRDYIGTYQVGILQSIINLTSVQEQEHNLFKMYPQIRVSGTNWCVESEKDVTFKGSTFVLAKCSRTKRQMWSETSKGELVLAEILCLQSPESSAQKPHLSKCHEMGGLQEWKHHDEVNFIIFQTIQHAEIHQFVIIIFLF